MTSASVPLMDVTASTCPVYPSSGKGAVAAACMTASRIDSQSSMNAPAASLGCVSIHPRNESRTACSSGEDGTVDGGIVVGMGKKVGGGGGGPITRESSTP